MANFLSSHPGFHTFLSGFLMATYATYMVRQIVILLGIYFGDTLNTFKVKYFQYKKIFLMGGYFICLTYFYKPELDRYYLPAFFLILASIYLPLIVFRNYK